ncbi:branched-chain amino acid ABC transporter permease, partial [Agrobacterium sp. MS2]
LWAAGFIGRVVMRPLAKASPNAVTVASIGVLIALTESARLAADTRQLWLPPLLSEPIRFWADGGFAVTLTPMQMLNTTAFSLLILAGSFYLGRSAFGRRWKAVSDDAFAAALCGVNAGRIFLMSYCAAGLVAAIAGVQATFYYGTMDFGAGLVFGLKVVLISAAGGYASPLICGLGAAAVGFAETFWVGYGPAAWRDAMVLAMLVGWLVIMRSRVEAP